MSESVLFVSKPIAPPFHDGSKCLVRDVARHLTRIDPIVMSLPDAPELRPAPGARSVRAVAAYGAPGGFTPALSANLRAAAWLFLRSRASVWHFVFAPNPRTSGAGRALSRLRRVKVVQTVASPPRTFERPERLFFGDRVVAQSTWTRRSIERAYERAGLRAPRLLVIPPPVPEIAAPSAEEIQRARAHAGLDSTADYLIYPGDLETSAGAETTALIAERLSLSAPETAIVFAYRRKSARAREIAARLSTRLARTKTRFVEDAPNILALVGGARALLFPVDDLWGKVDLPIILLEAMDLGVPVIALDRGPLEDLSGVVKVSTLEVGAWVHEATAFLAEGALTRRDSIAKREREALDLRHRASSVARAYEDLYLELAAERGRLR